MSSKCTSFLSGGSYSTPNSYAPLKVHTKHTSIYVDVAPKAENYSRVQLIHNFKSRASKARNWYNCPSPFLMNWKRFDQKPKQGSSKGRWRQPGSSACVQPASERLGPAAG